jgi:hypothetical protein
MDDIRHLLRILFKTAIVAFFIAFFWWGITTFAPGLTLKTLFPLNASSTATGGWLPSPKSYQGLFGTAKTPSATDNVFVYGKEYNGGGNEVKFITYTSTSSSGNNVGVSFISGTQQDQLSQGSTTKKGSVVYSQKSLFVRNLSIYEGGHTYAGLTFAGEARDTMFLNGRFPIIIANQAGQVVSVAYAEATTNWTIPGWVKFQVLINTMTSSKVPCTMVFEQAKVKNSQTQPTRVAMPVTCN